MKPYMSNDDAMDLFRRIDELKESGDLSGDELKEQVESMQNKIVSSLSFLVYNIAKQYRSFSNYEDLVQEGFVGLIKAVRRFQWQRFPNFFVYSEQFIVHGVKRGASRFDIVYNPNRVRVVYAEPKKLLREHIPSDDTPEGVFFCKEKAGCIDIALSEFPDRDKEIVERIFGLSGHKPQTLREIGPIFDLTHERIRQIKNKAITKLSKNNFLSELNELS